MSSRNNYPAKRQRPVIRVFVSSTFSDLKLERDALARRVFPKLERMCQTEGFQFQAIDLRWGVSTEAGLDHRTMRICFEELRRSQEISPEPNFLILLGNRYGWRPLPEAISVRQFEKLASAAADVTTSDVDLGSPLEVLREWYLRDDNNVPPVHVLRSRIGTSCEGDKKRWERTEEVLWSVINQTYAPEALDTQRFQQPSIPLEERFSQPAFPEIVRFQASATEQEIWGGALSVDHPEQHVLACFREIQNLDEFRSENNPSGVDATGASDFLSVINGRIDQRLTDAQQQLKNELRKRLELDAAPPEQSHCFTLEGAELRETVDSLVQGDPAPRHGIHLSDAYRANMQTMCDWVTNRLETIIKQQIAEWRQLRNPAAAPNDSVEAHQTARDLEIERDEHLRLADEHTAHFVGRDEEDGPLERVQAYLDNTSRLPLLIHGGSGCGKTALLARAFKRVARESNPIIRFIGVTPKSSDIRSLLGNLCLELRRLETGSNPLEGRTPGEGLTSFQSQPLPTDIHELQQEFRQLLHTASEQQRPVVLFLDALDQLSEADGGLHLSWLPGRSSDPLPAGVKIVVSCLSDRHDDDPAGRPFAMLREVLPEDHVLELDALPPKDAIRLLDRWLSKASRTIGDENPNQNQKKQRDLIHKRLDFHKQCRQPLFLKLLSEEVKLWRSYDENCYLQKAEPRDPGTTMDEAASPLRSNPHVDALLRQLVNRLSDSTNHGKLLVERALGYLAAARRGLGETEILEVLFADPDYKTYLDAESKRTNHTLPTDPPRIPIALWSRLRSDLDLYLTERSAPGGNVLTFYHRQVAEWVKIRFVDNVKCAPHRCLADFFGKTSANLERRRIDEYPWQLSQARLWRRLSELLGDVDFLAQMWQHGYYEIEEYWARIEQHSDFRMIDTYNRIIRSPEEHITHLPNVVRLLRDSVTTRRELTATLSLCRVWEQHARTIGNNYALCRALAEQAVILGGLNEDRASLEVCKEMEKVCRATGDQKWLCVAIGGQATGHWNLDDADEAMRLHKIEEQLAREINDDARLQACLGNQASILESCHEFEDALRLREEQETLCRRLHHADGLAIALAGIARISMATRLSGSLQEEDFCFVMNRLKEQEAIGRRIGNAVISRESLRIQRAVLGRYAYELTERGVYAEALELYRKEERVCWELRGELDQSEVNPCLMRLLHCLRARANQLARLKHSSDEALELLREGAVMAHDFALPQEKSLIEAQSNWTLQYVNYENALKRYKASPFYKRWFQKRPKPPRLSQELAQFVDES